MSATITISGAEIRRKLDEGSALVIDVREPGEFAAGHVPGALNVPLGRLAGHSFGDLGGKEVVLVCASGRRSGRSSRSPGSWCSSACCWATSCIPGSMASVPLSARD